MLAVDTNILVYAHRREVTEHALALARVRELAEGDAPWAIPWPCVYEFFSVVTNPRIWKASAFMSAAVWAQLEAWTGSLGIRLLGETDDLLAVLEGMLTRPRVRGAIVHDARVAALCVAHGVEVLLSRDRDFSLFPELKIEDPFA